MFDATRLRVALAEKDVSIVELSKATGINRATISGLADNDRKVNPRLSTIEAIAGYFGKPVSFFLAESFDKVYSTEGAA